MTPSSESEPTRLASRGTEKLFSSTNRRGKIYCTDGYDMLFLQCIHVLSVCAGVIQQCFFALVHSVTHVGSMQKCRDLKMKFLFRSASEYNYNTNATITPHLIWNDTKQANFDLTCMMFAILIRTSPITVVMLGPMQLLICATLETYNIDAQSLQAPHNWKYTHADQGTLCGITKDSRPHTT